MRLADFIVSNIEPILMEWEVFARGIVPGAAMDALALRDHAPDILLATVQDMNSSQSETERSAKSRGRGGRRGGGAGGDGAAPSGAVLNGASELHAVGRLGSGFDLMEVVSEYRALRASVLQLWRDSTPAPHECDVDDLTRFNESIDQSVAKAVSSYTKRVDQARDMYLAILSHDLRNPLNSIALSAESLRRADLSERDADALGCASQISTNARVMGRMIGDLLDSSRAADMATLAGRSATPHPPCRLSPSRWLRFGTREPRAPARLRLHDSWFRMGWPDNGHDRRRGCRRRPRGTSARPRQT
jgi:signal transduction histidine kinase